MPRRLIYRLHAIQRLNERGVSLEAARQIIETGEIIRHYRDAKPFPSRLILGWVGDRPITSSSRISQTAM
ncbi:MAG TPA: DUF4258 domain-containing protein [Dehalococcoidia bacterium]|nr:DUF4258 domain-containing protein [Dehalococcoidia bacterium]